MSKKNKKSKAIERFIKAIDPDHSGGGASGDSKDASVLRAHIREITGLNA